MTIFANRIDAAGKLAKRLLSFKEDEPVVLALPRGGVPIGFVVAQALDAPLDLLLVRKIGAPGQPELAVGAVVNGTRAETVLNDDIVAMLGVPKEYIEQESARQLAEIKRRRALYLADRRPIDATGKTAIVVDDGIATGATVRAALRAVRRTVVKQLILAVPVAPADTVESLQSEVDELICLAMPDCFGAIGYFYEDFSQISDEEVIDLIRQSQRTAAPQAGESE